jgi:hypothetical protein
MLGSPVGVSGFIVDALGVTIRPVVEWFKLQVQTTGLKNRQVVQIQWGLSVNQQQGHSQQCMRTAVVNGGAVVFRVPEDWSETSTETNRVCLRPKRGGEFTAELREFQKPAVADTRGPSAEEMVRMQVEPFGGTAMRISATRAIGSHAVVIGEHGQKQNCRAWHLVNQAGPWHHQAVLFVYTPPDGCDPDTDLLALLDRELALCEFAGPVQGEMGTSEQGIPRQTKPWWRFW